MNALLEVKNVHKSFEGKHVHRGVSFMVKTGETIGLLGHSGTGKSVLLRSLIGLEDIDEGSILFKGTRIDNLREEQLFNVRTKMSYSFQNGALFDSVNVFENIAFPLFEHTKLKEKEIERKVNEILDMVNMKESRELMPSDLSGGMQKRIGLARSMALDPELMLYDEPTAGLDPVNVEMVLEIMSKFKSQGLSAIFVTHDIPAARKICDRLLILKNGVIHFDGTAEDFDESQDPFIQQFSSLEQ